MSVTVAEKKIINPDPLTFGFVNVNTRVHREAPDVDEKNYSEISQCNHQVNVINYTWRESN